jgi:RNA polymerase sigma-70 factor, ECF subfamily
MRPWLYTATRFGSWDVHSGVNTLASLPSVITLDQPPYSQKNFVFGEYKGSLRVMLSTKSQHGSTMNEGGNPNPTFSQVALEHLDALYGFAMVLTRNQTEAEDLVQETYLRAVRAFGRLMPDSNLKSWLFAIMRNAWLNQLRHNRSGPLFVEIDAEESARSQWLDHRSNDPHIVYLRKLERDEVKAAIDCLPRMHREIVLLRDIEGFSYQQIATILDCPMGTVMSRLGRARERLRQLLIEWRTASSHRSARAKEA